MGTLPEHGFDEEIDSAALALIPRLEWMADLHAAAEMDPNPPITSIMSSHPPREHHARTAHDIYADAHARART